MYTISELTRALPIHTNTARRWRRRRRVPPVASLMLKVKLEGDLAVISDKWTGWRLVGHKLYSPEGVEWTAGALNAWAFERQLVAEVKRRDGQFRPRPRLALVK